jgi:putative 4-mercaptohistidine N1-methyltranferase
MSFYESDRALAEYLLFHYGTRDQTLARAFGPAEAVGFPARCATELPAWDRLSGRRRALDLGCAVGRSSFELAREFEEVIGIDLSSRFIAAARTLAEHGSLLFDAAMEGDLTLPMEALVPRELDRGRVRFETGDAQRLPFSLGQFDLVLAVNLIDRLPRPAAFLRGLDALVRPGGQVAIASPFTWLEEYTARSEWLGGRVIGGQAVRSSESLRRIMEPAFALVGRRDVPFLIREHERKYQWSIADATTWERR